MAVASTELIAALRTTAERLRSGATYRWTHLGACNCGHLAQTLTHLDRAEIHRRALMRAGDWSEQCVEYCGTSGLPIDDVFRAMLDAGLELADLANLERLSDARILARLPVEQRMLDYRDRDHVIRYLEAWADQLEERLASVDDSGVRARGVLARTG